MFDRHLKNAAKQFYNYRLPEHYKARHQDFLNTLPKPVHYKPAEKPIEIDHDTNFV